MAGIFITGEQIQQLADALPPITPKDLGPVVEGLAISFGIVSCIAVCLRTYVRAGLSGIAPRLLGIEDYLCILSALLLIPAVVFSVLGTRYGLGCHDHNLPSPVYLIRAVKYETLWVPFYIISSTSIKCAIGLTCTRLDRRKRVIIPLYINMAVIVIVTILALAFTFSLCRPFAAMWNPLLGHCQTKVSIQLVSYITSIFQMATDWVCAIIPFFIVSNLQMSLRRKLLVNLLLGLGILASIATCIRIPTTYKFSRQKYEDSPAEVAYNLAIVTITSNLEVCLGIIACSLPPLRNLFKFYHDSSRGRSHQYTRESDGYAAGGSHQAVRLDSINRQKGTSQIALPFGSQDNVSEDDNSSSRGIIRRAEV